jgi:septal ring factor EnvC (AmiA/AmiB activator)
MFIKLLKCLSGENEENEKASIIRAIYMEQVIAEKNEEIKALKLINKDLRETVKKLENQVANLTTEIINKKSNKAEIEIKKTTNKKAGKEEVSLIENERITDEEILRLTNALGVKVIRREDFTL